MRILIVGTGGVGGFFGARARARRSRGHLGGARREPPALRATASPSIASTATGQPARIAAVDAVDGLAPCDCRGRPSSRTTRRAGARLLAPVRAGRTPSCCRCRTALENESRLARSPACRRCCGGDLDRLRARGAGRRPLLAARPRSSSASAERRELGARRAARRALLTAGRRQAPAVDAHPERGLGQARLERRVQRRHRDHAAYGRRGASTADRASR